MPDLGAVGFARWDSRGGGTLGERLVSFDGSGAMLAVIAGVVAAIVVTGTLAAAGGRGGARVASIWPRS